MPKLVTIGLDTARNVFQLHSVDRSRRIVLRKALRCSPVQGFTWQEHALSSRHVELTNDQ
jgi:hypothetical protein